MSKIIGFFSEWQIKSNTRHPLLSQFLLNLIVGVLLIKIGFWMAGPKPRTDTISMSPSSSVVTISNAGILPATKDFKIISSDAAIIIQDVKEGKDYITVKPTTNEKVQYLSITSLPMGKTVKLDIEGSGSVRIEESNWKERN